MAKDKKFAIYVNHKDLKEALCDLPLSFLKKPSGVKEGTLAVVIRYLTDDAERGTYKDAEKVIDQVQAQNVPIIVLDDKLTPQHSRDVWLKRNVVRYLPLDEPDTAWAEVRRFLTTRIRYRKRADELSEAERYEVGRSVEIPPDKFGHFNLISLFVGAMGDFMVDLKLMLDAIRPVKLDRNPVSNLLDLSKALEFECAVRHNKNKHTYEGSEYKKRDMINYLRENGGKALFGNKPSATTRNHIIIEGETGTGKTLIARFIHDYIYQDFRNHKELGELREVSCANLGEKIMETQLFGSIKGAYTDAVTRAGAILEAFNGTVFLDEIGELTPELQARLLSYLENQRIAPTGWAGQGIYVPAFLVAATNRRLEKEVERGTFRRDLHHRLGFTVTIPPLRERIGDLERLVDFVLQNPKINPKRGKGPHAVAAIEREAVEILRRYRFPGNFRELEQVMRRSVVRAISRGVDVITAEIVRESLGAR